MAELDKNLYSNRTLERVSLILDAVGIDSRTSSEISLLTGLSSSTTHRLVQSMELYGFLTRTSDGRYAVGRRLVENSLGAIATPVLKSLSNFVGESVQLWVKVDNSRVCKVSIEAEHELRVTLPEGTSLSLPQGSAGMVLDSPDSYAGQGWAESVGQRTPGVSSVSAPVLFHGDVVAAVCIVAPIARIKTSPGADFGEVLKKAAKTITQLISH